MLNVEIDLNCFRNNISIIKNNLKNSLFCLVVKADAYGHGLEEIVKVAKDVDYFAIASVEEAIKIRCLGVKKPILLLGSFFEEEIFDIIKYDINCTISSFYEANLILNYCNRYKKRCKVHLEVDTGMQRTGVRWKEAFCLFEFLKNNSCFRLNGIYSHFALSNEMKNPFSSLQIKRFDNLLKKLDYTDIICHLANSGGLCYFPSSLKTMSRIGALGYGCYLNKLPPHLKDLQPCMRVNSKVVHIKKVDANQGISYGHTYYTSKKTNIAVIPVGYADGYRRDLSNRGFVLIRGKRYKVVGNICMNQFMVDIGFDDIKINDEVVLMGKQEKEVILVNEIADFCNSINYEILTSFGKNKKVYIK